MTGKPATRKYRVGLFLGYPKHDEGGERRRRVAAQPLGVGGADGRRQAIGWAEDFNSTVFAVVSSCDPEMLSLLGRQRVSNGCDGTHQFIPAKLFAQVAVAFEGVRAQRPRGRDGYQRGYSDGAQTQTTR